MKRKERRLEAIVEVRTEEFADIEVSPRGAAMAQNPKALPEHSGTEVESTPKEGKRKIKEWASSGKAMESLVESNTSWPDQGEPKHTRTPEDMESLVWNTILPDDVDDEQGLPDQPQAKGDVGFRGTSQGPGVHKFGPCSSATSQGPGVHKFGPSSPPEIEGHRCMKRPKLSSESGPNLQQTC